VSTFGGGRCALSPPRAWPSSRPSFNRGLDDLYGLDKSNERRRDHGDLSGGIEDAYPLHTNETTALHCAVVVYAMPESVEFLLAQGRMPRPKDGWGRDTYEVAKLARADRGFRDREERMRRLDEIILMLENYG